jgi:hypothetical protein
LVETILGFVANDPLLGSFRLCAAISEPMSGSRLLGFLPLDALSRGPKIDNVAH